MEPVSKRVVSKDREEQKERSSERATVVNGKNLAKYETGRMGRRGQRRGKKVNLGRVGKGY